MYCLSNICHVCLEKTSKLISNINNSSVNKDIMYIIGYLPFNLAWLKTKRILLICEQCCLRLRETCNFLEICLRTSALLQGYMDKLKTSSISNTDNEAKLFVNLNIEDKDIEVKREIQLEDEEIHTFQWQRNIGEIEEVFVDFEDSLIKEAIICKKEVDDKQNSNPTEVIEETEDVFVNVEDYFVKEENTWKREQVDTDEYSTDNNFTYNIGNESDSEISVNENAHLTNADRVSSGFTRKQTHAKNKNDLNTATKKSYKCSTCSKSFIRKSNLNIHTRTHSDEKPFECAICKKRFREKGYLVLHMRIHTGEKPFECSNCKKCFTSRFNLVRHLRIHTGEKPFECSNCKKCFTNRFNLVRHLRIHTGEKPFECSNCKKCFTNRFDLVRHVRMHIGEKPFVCSNCKKCFTSRSHLVRHLRIHTGEKPFECSNCKKCFTNHSNLVRHLRIHTGVDHMPIHTNEKPYHCIKCKKSFRFK